MSANNCFILYEDDYGNWYGWDEMAEASTVDSPSRKLKLSEAKQGKSFDDVYDALRDDWLDPEYGTVIVDIGKRKTIGWLPKDGTPIRIVDDVKIIQHIQHQNRLKT